MEGEIVGQECPINNSSDAAFNSMPSATGTDSISIELTGAVRYNGRAMEYHDHFSLRGFVAGVRERDWLKCYPFPLVDSDDMIDGQRQLLPPLDTPKYKWWHCKRCVDESCLEKDERTANSGSGAECGALLKERAMNADNCNVCHTHDHYACPSNEKGKKDGLSDTEPAIRNLEWIAKCAAESCKSGELTVTANQEHAESTKDSSKVTESTKVAKVADNGFKGQSTGFPLPDSLNCCSLVHKHGNLPEKDSQDRNLDKLTSFHRKKARKVRLLADLLGGNGYTKKDHVRIWENSENITYDIPAGLSTSLNVPRSKIDSQMNLKVLGQNRKRKVPAEEGDIFSNKVAHKDHQNREEDANKNNAIRSTRSKDLWTGIVVKSGLDRLWSNVESDIRPFLGKNKYRKIREDDTYLPSAPPRGEARENLTYDNVATQAGQTDKFNLKLAPATFTDHERPIFSLHGDAENVSISKRKGKMTQIGENVASLSCKNGMVADIPMRQRNEDVLPMGRIDKHREKGIDKRLQLSLNSCLPASNYDRELVASCNDKQLFPKQVGTSKVDQVFGKEMETSLSGVPSICFPYGLTNIYEKGFVGDPSIQMDSFRMLAMNEGTYSSEVNDAIHIYKKQKELNGASKNKRNIEAQSSSVSGKKQFNETTDNATDQSNIDDDIPMEILELMAKNQYERGLPDNERANCLLQANNLSRNQQMVNCFPMPCSEELRLHGDETCQKRKWKERKGQNGFIVTGENDANYHNISSRVQYHIPFAAGEVCQSKKNTPSDLRFLSENSSGVIGALNHNWKEGNLGYHSPYNIEQDSGGCDRHKTILNPDREAFRMDIFSHGSSLLSDHNMKRHNNVHLFNFNTLNTGEPNTDYGVDSSARRRAGVPFPTKSGGTELQKSSRGSGEFNSNDTIPAMHLLSLMQSGTSFDVNAGESTPKRSSCPHDYNTKLNIGTSRDRNYMKHLPFSYFSDNCVAQNSNCAVFGSPPFGASIPLIQHERRVSRNSNANEQILPHSGNKEKMKSSISDMQIRTSQSQRSQKNALMPIQHSQKRFPAVPDHVSNGCSHIGNENYPNLNLQYQDTRDVSRPLRRCLNPKICTINRNPADFSTPDAGNAYMIKGEDLRFEKASLYINGGFANQRGYKRNRNLKQTSQKESTKH